MCHLLLRMYWDWSSFLLYNLCPGFQFYFIQEFCISLSFIFLFSVLCSFMLCFWIALLFELRLILGRYIQSNPINDAVCAFKINNGNSIVTSGVVLLNKHSGISVTGEQLSIMNLIGKLLTNSVAL